MMNSANADPKRRRIAWISVVPEAIVTRLTATVRTSVQKQERASAQVSDIPCSAPALAIEVTLPVPMM